MATLAANALILGLVIREIYRGYKKTAYVTTLHLMKVMIAVTSAMTFSWPLADFAAESVSALASPPWRDLLAPAFFLTLGIWIYVALHELEIRFLPPDADLLGMADKVLGPVLGGMAGALMAGGLVIAWSLVPAAKYFPSGLGVINHNQLVWDAGFTTAKFYEKFSDAMYGEKKFLLYDEPTGSVDEDHVFRQDWGCRMNFIPLMPGQRYIDEVRNGRWDRGFLYRYWQTHRWTTQQVEDLRR
ncbi:MAG TPA: CvpA family protein [Candidatus Brocadiia bacterium]|nr:CvpA family protein [Candidatus Brocadiia bacterium]